MNIQTLSFPFERWLHWISLGPHLLDTKWTHHGPRTLRNLRRKLRQINSLPQFPVPFQVCLVSFCCCKLGFASADLTWICPCFCIEGWPEWVWRIYRLYSKDHPANANSANGKCISGADQNSPSKINNCGDRDVGHPNTWRESLWIKSGVLDNFMSFHLKI